MSRVLRGSLALGIVALAGSATTGASPAGREYSVAIANMAYGSAPSGLKVGDSIVWVNKDSVPHTVTSRDRSFDLRIGPGQRGRLNLTKAGTFQVYCIYHAPMRATLSVSG